MEPLSTNCLGKLNLFLAKPCSDPSNYFPIEYDFVPLVPMQVKNIITSNKINKIKQLLIGGGKVNDEMITQIKKFKTQVFAHWYFNGPNWKDYVRKL